MVFVFFLVSCAIHTISFIMPIRNPNRENPFKHLTFNNSIEPDCQLPAFMISHNLYANEANQIFISIYKTKTKKRQNKNEKKPNK